MLSVSYTGKNTYSASKTSGVLRGGASGANKGYVLAHCGGRGGHRTEKMCTVKGGHRTYFVDWGRVGTPYNKEYSTRKIYMVGWMSGWVDG